MCSYKIQHKFNNEKDMAGVDWQNGFLNRNPDYKFENEGLLRQLGLWHSTE